MSALKSIIRNLAPGGQADRIVPWTGYTAQLTVFAAAAMAFLAVFALALSVSAGRLAARWDAGLARSATIRISAPEGQVEAQTEAALKVLKTTAGVASARALADAEERALLEPWFGPDLPVETLPIPRLIDVVETAEGFDADGLRLRLQAEAPGAVLDDHTRWRRPMAEAAGRLRFLGVLSAVLIAAATAAMITLAANAALAANAQVIRVLRLVGAKDGYIAGAFVRRFTWRASAGAAAGAFLALIAVLLMPAAGEDGFLTGIGFRGAGWLWPVVVPVFAGAVSYLATGFAARRALKELM